MIRVAKVSKSFGRVQALKDISFSVADGQSLALWGSNGAGKTTLVRCLLGIHRASGEIAVSGIDVRRTGRHARALAGYVPQELAFHDDVRLGAAILFFASLRGATRGRACESLAAVGLTGHEGKRVRDLSGGMKQRLALAIAMLSDPPLIVLDEPTSNLDAAGRGDVVAMLRELKASGKTLLFASHRPDEVIALADRVLVMEAGRIVRDTTPLELWPTEKPVQTIRLHLELASESSAAEILREAGHAVHWNGHGLCVAVPRDQKALPVHALALRGIVVRDLEVLDELSAPGESR